MFKARIWNEENVVLFQILEQDESLRNNKTIFTSKTYSMSINSYNYPELRLNSVYIRGLWNLEDNDTLRYAFKNTREAIEYINRVENTIKEWEESVNIVNKIIGF